MVVGEFTTEAELVVIGGGPAGYATAFRAAELGIDVTLVDDRDGLGGTWLREGCVLSKDLTQLAQTVNAAARLETSGVTYGRPTIDLERVRATLRAGVEHAAADLDATCERLGVSRVQGRARFDSSRELTIVGGHVPRIRFRRAVIATGAREQAPNGSDLFDGDRVMSLGRALALPDVPATLLVVGGGPNSLELAGVYAALGSRVTVITPDTHLVSEVDDDLLEVLVTSLAERLDEICLDVSITALTAHSDGGDDSAGQGIDADFGGSGTPPGRTTFDRVLLSAGRWPNTDGLNLEHTGVTLDDHGAITVDEQLRTTDPRIYAVGDVVGAPMVAVKATRQGRVAAEAVAGEGSVFDARVIPMVLFTEPQVAWCGLTEASARADGRLHAVERTRWSGGGTGSITKIVYDPETQLVLGVGIVGPGAAELIAEGALAIEMGAVVTDLAATLHAHPTASAHLSAAAQQAEDAGNSG